MKNLTDQDEFEMLIGRTNSIHPIPFLSVIWFTAKWCGPCKKVDIVSLEENFPANWLKCDIDDNQYTPGFCGIRSIPTFLVIYKTKILGTISSSVTSEILQFLQTLKY